MWVFDSSILLIWKANKLQQNDFQVKFNFLWRRDRIFSVFLQEINEKIQDSIFVLQYLFRQLSFHMKIIHHPHKLLLQGIPDQHIILPYHRAENAKYLNHAFDDSHPVFELNYFMFH